MDDAGRACEELVRVDFLHRLRDGLGAEGAVDLLEGEEFGRGGVLDEVHIGESALRARRLLAIVE
jgi:hypothetical protein